MENRIECERIDDGKENYVKLVQPDGCDFADRIFSYEEIPGFLSMEIRKRHGCREAYYNVTGKISLARFFAEGTFTRSDLIDILLQISALQDELEEYLLEGGDLLVHEEFLYIDRGTGKVEGIYYAGSGGGNIQAYGHLMEAVMERMDQKNKELVFFVYGLHKCTRESGCVRGDIKRYISEEISDEITAGEISKEAPSDRPARLCGMSRTVPVTQKGQKGSGKAVRKEDMKNGIPLYSGLAFVSGILCLFFLWKTGAFTDPAGGGLQKVRFGFAVLFFLVVCGYAAWRLYPVKAGKKKDRGGIQIHRERDSGFQICLIPEKSGERLIPVDHSPFYIGKNTGSADAVLEEGGVSDLHLMIFQENKSVYAVDHESAQGTLHNGIRMVPWQNRELRDGDRLTIGTHEFVVEITSSGYVM